MESREIMTTETLDSPETEMIGQIDLTRAEQREADDAHQLSQQAAAEARRRAAAIDHNTVMQHRLMQMAAWTAIDQRPQLRDLLQATGHALEQGLADSELGQKSRRLTHRLQQARQALGTQQAAHDAAPGSIGSPQW